MQILDRRFKYEAAVSAALISLMSILSYGLFLGQLGYYRDDWYLIWTARSLGPDGIISLFRGDRPLNGWIYVLDYNLLGSSPLGWHVYALLLRLAGALAFWWLLRTVWPNKRLETTLMALLFVVYPGFYQQPNAATFKMLLLAYAAAMLSITLSLQAVRRSNLFLRYTLVVVAILLAGLYLYIYEALIGLEVIRLLLLWYFLRQQQALDLKQDLLRLLKTAYPYLVLAAGFLYWRLFLYSSTRRATSLDVLVGGYEAAPLHGFLSVLVESIKDWIETTFFAWTVPLYQFIGSFRYRDVLAAFALALIGVGLFLLYSRFAPQPSEEEPGGPAVARDWIWLGALTIVVTTTPIILAGRNVRFAIQWDRYTFQSLIGVALFLGGVIFYSLRGRSRWVLASALIASGLMTQYLSGAYYRDFWTAERNFWWQLSWRAPSIQPGTTLIASFPGEFQLAEEYEVWGPLNLAFSSGQAVMPLAGQILFSGIAVDLERGTVEERLVRGTVTVERDYNRSLVASLPSMSACVHVINGENPLLPLNERDSIARIAPYSDIGLIDTSASPVTPPTDVFGAEPAYNWCYYYQKIGLALQQGRWPDAARLADESLARDLRPEEQSEWMPVVEAYFRNGQAKEARQVSKFIADKSTRLYLCQQLQRAQASANGYPATEIMNIMCGQAG